MISHRGLVYSRKFSFAPARRHAVYTQFPTYFEKGRKCISVDPLQSLPMVPICGNYRPFPMDGIFTMSGTTKSYIDFNRWALTVNTLQCLLVFSGIDSSGLQWVSSSLVAVLCWQGFVKIPSLVRCYTTSFPATFRFLPLAVSSDDVLLVFSGHLAKSANRRPNDYLDALHRYFFRWALKLNVGECCATAFLGGLGIQYFYKV